MKLFKILLLLVLTGLNAQAQNYDLGEVTKEELEEKKHPKDPSAPAAVLFSKGQTYMMYNETKGFSLITEVQVKIKIYTKDGYSWANKNIPFYSYESTKESVDISRAATYNLEAGVIKKTKLKSEGEFSEQVNKWWKQKKIMMPDVKEGSIVEYKYTITSPIINVLNEWKFQESIPVNHSEFTTKIPEYYVFNPNFRGYYTPKVTKEKNTRAINYVEKERDGQSPTRMTNSKIDYIEEATTYVLNDLPGMKEEKYSGNVENYTASIEHELSMVKYPHEPTKTYSSNWEDVATTIYKNDDFGPELKRTGYFEEDVKALLAGLNSPTEKTAAIFSYVKNRMNWNSYASIFCDQGVKKAYAAKVGNAAEINLMLTGMLRYAGVDANPVLISTRSNKIALFPNRSAFNYVICAVSIDDKLFLLDATSKSAVPNILPTRALNWSGRLIRNDGTSLAIDLTPQMISKEVVNMTAKMDAEGKITGKIRDQHFDHIAFGFREQYLGISQESYLEKLEGNFKGLEVSQYKVLNDKDLSKPVIEEYDFIHNASADVIADKMYINPMLFLTQAENPFKQEKREYPIDFVYPHQDKYMINISIPDGYVVESLPNSIAISMEDNIGTFKYNIANGAANQIQIAVTMDINFASVPQDYYATLKDFYQKVIEKQNEKIVLKKQ
ncbi:DUF3857 domain-containing protein [Flavobacterium subsaxonicum]|uniref:Transglutaminase n=1 Tax=Flavobacterium subsaxonicum WB 4.1-42 = DSM 21790 TaxID=1121898 RepID=A0A0A2MRZ0_9FLAO|nr:DUF3857 domain-containing protein [Flavobacterium subsaxonicum]KGO94193.1 transglutaminase [Flavobacterium subsaxonicum WB 4.1-42 = DSM 21790]